MNFGLPNPDKPVVAKRKPRFIGELKIEYSIKNDKLVKSPKLRHACEGRHPELFENTGFPPSRE